MLICFDAAAFQFVYEHVHCRFILVSGNYHAVYLQIVSSENIEKPQHFQVICYPEILSGLACGDVAGVDAHDDLRMILQPLEKFDLGVLVKARKNSHGMLVFNQLAAEFQVEPAFAAPYPLEDVL